LITISLFYYKIIYCQIVINEVSSATFNKFLDEDNSAEDWIELYNNSSFSFNLNGYKLERDENGNIKSWTFPNVFIKPYSYLTVFCSEKNRTAWFDHWEVPVYANNMWKYFIGLTEPPQNWYSTNFNDITWQSGIGGIGYGDNDDSTVIPQTTSLYMRKSFYISDTSKIEVGALLIDYDDAFVAYLNGVEIARANIGVYGDHPAYNTYAYDEHEAKMYQNGNFSGAFWIPENIIDSALKPGNNVFAIQTHNFNDGMDDLSSIPYLLIGVSDTTVTYFPFPASVHLHTNFNLTNTGQKINLINQSGTLIDSKEVGYIHINNSFGRNPDGSTNWCIFDKPSPDSTNNQSACYSGYAVKPVINKESGFYNNAQTISISTQPDFIIKYTTDGSEPSELSLTYNNPFVINTNTVIRARSFSIFSNILPSVTTTKTYLINENITLPVLSLSTNPENLFDWNYGIYMLGPGADTTTPPFMGANFWNNWSRPAHLDFFDEKNNFKFDINAEIKIQGNYSKAWAQKGFSVKLKDDYDGYNLKYKLFPDKNITDFKSFNIRNAGTDWNTCHMRDRLNQKNVQNFTHLDIMDGRPCVLFVNGNYFGVYELREKQDKFYIANNNNVDKDKLDFLEFDGSVIEGSNKNFFTMVDFIKNNNMSIVQNYDSATKMLDINNFTDYFITETYIANIDWLGNYTNNIKFWRTNEPISKWRYMLWDTDITLGFAQGQDSANLLKQAINPQVENPHSVMLKSLLNNDNYKNYFVNRYCDLINSIFRPYKFISKSEDLKNEMYSEMQRHFSMWHNNLPFPWSLFVGRSSDVNSWEMNIDTMQIFMAKRPFYMLNFLKEQFNLVKQVNITFKTEPDSAGKIVLNTLTLDSFPWIGTYFDGVPISFSIIPNSGYEFIYWQSPDILQNKFYENSLTVNFIKDETVTAYFKKLDYNIDVFPNPFNNELTINFEIPVESQVSLKIINVLGEEVANLISDNVFNSPGSYSINVDTRNYSLSDGLYFVKLRTPEYSHIIKIIKIKN